MSESEGTIDFFISYRGPQAAWARWVNWVVRMAGFSTVLMDEFRVGTTWTSNMRNAARDCVRLVPLISDEYWTSGGCMEEFDAYWRKHLQNSTARFLLPFVIQDCTVPDMHAMLLHCRLHTLTREAAREAILHVLAGITAVASGATVFIDPEPPFPGTTASSGALADPPAPSFHPFPASSVTVDRKGFVDCKAAFETFERMLTADPPERILLVHGHGSQGKSRLLSTLYNHTRAVIGPKSTARVEFKKAGSTPDEHVVAIARALGVAAPTAGNIIQRIDELLDRCAARPVVIFFDAFEHAEHQHRHWAGRVLDRCLDDRHLRCVMAGREVPPSKNQPWAHLTCIAECDALKDREGFVAHAIANGYKGDAAEIAVMVSTVALLRDQFVSKGNRDHGISSESLIDEIRSLCAKGATLT